MSTKNKVDWKIDPNHRGDQFWHIPNIQFVAPAAPLKEQAEALAVEPLRAAVREAIEAAPEFNDFRVLRAEVRAAQERVTLAERDLKALHQERAQAAGRPVAGLGEILLDIDRRIGEAEGRAAHYRQALAVVQEPFRVATAAAEAAVRNIIGRQRLQALAELRPQLGPALQQIPAAAREALTHYATLGLALAALEADENSFREWGLRILHAEPAK